MTWRTVGDTAPPLTGTVNADLTGATAVVHIRRADRTTISRTATITDPTTGTWSIALQAGDLTVAGRYQVEVAVTYSSGGVQTFGRDASGNLTAFTVDNQIV